MDKVAVGARLVISAVVKQSCNGTTVALNRAAHHGLDLSSKLHPLTQSILLQNTTAIARQQISSNLPPSPSPPSSSSAINDDDYNIQNDGPTAVQAAKIINQDHSIPNPYLVHTTQPECVQTQNRKDGTGRTCGCCSITRKH